MPETGSEAAFICRSHHSLWTLKVKGIRFFYARLLPIWVADMEGDNLGNLTPR